MTSSIDVPYLLMICTSIESDMIFAFTGSFLCTNSALLKKTSFAELARLCLCIKSHRSNQSICVAVNDPSSDLRRCLPRPYTCSINDFRSVTSASNYSYSDDRALHSNFQVKTTLILN